MRFLPDKNMVVSASWDNTLKFWDCRSPPTQPAGSFNLPERAYAMDAKGNIVVCALAGGLGLERGLVWLGWLGLGLCLVSWLGLGNLLGICERA